MGSGFLISEDGLIVTNQHVIGRNPSEISVSMTDGSTYDAELIGSDELTDIALLKIQSEEVFPFIEMSDSDEIVVGEWSIALGNPFGLFDDGKPTVTVGVVSAINRDFRPDPNNPRTYIDMIQTDAAINRGNSGGPLLNSDGEVIGINTFIYTGGTSSGFVGLGFAIPSNRIERIISQLLSSGSVVLDYDPGMEFTSMTDQLIYRYRLPYVQGLLVTSVNKNGPAYECGIMPGDIIVRIGRERVISEMHAMALLREYEVGEKMEIELIRDGDLYQTEMILRQKVTSG
jgi:serine protease Do